MNVTGRGFLRLAAMVAAVFMLALGAAGVAAVLPTDSQPLVIETQSGEVEVSVELALTPDDRATGALCAGTQCRNRGAPGDIRRRQGASPGDRRMKQPRWPVSRD